MLPTALVTLITFFLEVCKTSPVYNMQPAFITNTVGSAASRNIRNLPCISRRNSNQSGYCMFAIDCLKANGTHLGTCIDGFYFGSCCHIEPVHDVVDNTIDTDIIPHREPPFRISSTTIKTVASSSHKPSPTTITSSSSIIANNTGITDSTSLWTKPVSSSTIGHNVPTSTTTNIPTTTTFEKLQTFQIVETKTTIAPLLTSTSSPKPESKEPISSTTRKPILVTKTSTKSPSTSSTTAKSTSKPTKTTTSVKPTHSDITTKPSKTTKIPPTKITQKPTKPTRPSTTTKKYQTTSKPRTTPATKPTKYTISTSRPTKRTTEQSTTYKLTTVLPTATKTTTIKYNDTSTASPPPVSVSPASNIESTSSKLTLNEKSTTEPLETINGNLVTNGIEDTQGSSKPTTEIPGLITWTIPNNSNVTASPTTESYNVTSGVWIPITTPDGWVLLPSVPSNETSSNDTTSSSLDSSPTKNASQPSTSTVMSTMLPITLPTPFDKPSISSIDITSSTASTTINIVSEGIVSSTERIPESSSITDTLSTESFEKPVNMSDFTDVCGRRMYPEARIVGGDKSSFGRWPWQISLRQWRTSTYLHKCGAALLNENWAITAAHCVDNVAPSDLLLRLGEHDLSTESEPYLHQERRVQIVASHPQFDPRTFEYDLALLRFYEPVTFQPNILPVCVPQTDENFVGKTAYVTGWGRLYEDGPLPSILQEVSVPVINNTVCESMYRAAGYIELIPHIFICAGWKRGGFDSCEGDSGGPMVIQRKDNRFLLAGVISWGIGCAEPNQPGVYTRISEFRDWINQILQF